MSEKERLAEVAALLSEYDRKLEEAEVVRRKLHAVINPNSSGVRKKATRKPQDVVREVMQ